jgi:multidrug transporter EmrE-like cation transporter
MLQIIDQERASVLLAAERHTLEMIADGASLTDILNDLCRTIDAHLNGIGAVFQDARAWTGLIFGLGLVGTGLTYVIYYYIVENLGAVAAAGVTYIPPVVALVIGVFLVGDTIHPIGYAALILILAGVAVLQLGCRPASKEISKAQTTAAQESEAPRTAGLAQPAQKA